MKYSLLIKMLLGIFFTLAIVRVLQLDGSTIVGADHRHIYTGTQLLKTGLNPYNDSLLIRTWNSIGGEGKIGMPTNPLIYPPFTVGIYTLITPDQWLVARTLFLLLCAASLLITLLLFYFRAQLQWYYAVLVLLSLKFIPYLLLLAQPTLLVLAAYAIYFRFKSVDKASAQMSFLKGLALGFCWIKPTLFLPLFLFLLFKKKWLELVLSLWFPILGMMVYFFYLPTEILGESMCSFYHNVTTLQANVLQPDAYFIREMTIFIRPLIQWGGISYKEIWWLPLGGLCMGLGYFLWRYRKMSARQMILYLALLTWLCLYHPAYDVVVLWLFFCFLYKEIKMNLSGLFLISAIGVFSLPLPVDKTCLYPITLMAIFGYLIFLVESSSEIK